MQNSWTRAWLAALALLVLSGAIARRYHDALLEAEEPVMNWLLDGTDTSRWEAASIFGDPWLVYPGTLILALIAWRFSQIAALTIIGTMAGGVLVSLITKQAVGRVRPDALVEASGPSFPSTYVVQAGIFWGLFTIVVWWLGAPRLVVHIVLELSIVFVLLTAIGRVIAGYHWPSDIVGSAIVISLSLISAAAVMESRGPEHTRLFSRSSAPAPT